MQLAIEETHIPVPEITSDFLMALMAASGSSPLLSLAQYTLP